jgi:hypothetical protein
MTYEKRAQIVNKCLNFFADTTDVDYVEELSAAEVQREYAECRDMARDFPEIKKYFPL